MTLPFKALSLLLRNTKLLLLSFFPGTLTFLSSLAITYYTWIYLLLPYSWWIEVPAGLVTFFLTWLIVGNLSLMPVEDMIVDEVQRATSGKVILAAPVFSGTRLLREFGFSLATALTAVLLLLLSLIPGLWPVTFACAAWLTAYGFLSTLYGRATSTIRERIRLFSRDWFHNLALGAFLNVLLFIPILNVFLLGYSLILSTLVFMKRRADQ